MRSCGRIVVVLGVLLGGCEGDSPPDHGAVKLLVLPSEAADSSVFAGTVGVRITMRYDECLADFYTAHPEYGQTGDRGEAVFAEWTDRLCDLDIEGMVDCTVTSIEQELGDPSQLTVELAVSGELAHRVVPFGPLPSEELTGCLPCVQFVGVWGLDGNGEPIMGAETFSPDEVCTDQGGEMAVHLGAP
jgi:hypothetical protein